MSGKVVCATDGSESGNHAVDLAAEMSGKLGRDLCIVHVMLHGRPTAEFRHFAETEGLVEAVADRTGIQKGSDFASLQGLFASAADEVETARLTVALGEQIAAAARARAEDAGARHVTARTCVGDYADEILDVAKAEEASMIVMGRRGLGRVREALLGSVSQKVLHHAPCTVVIVH